MLRLNHIKKIYNKTEVLKDINYSFRKGRIYAILGRNGSGRSTLFECISGDVSLDDGAVATKAKSVLFYAAKQSVFPMYITGYEFVRFICRIQKSEKSPEYYLERVGISSKLADTLISEYGFEDKKRLQLAAFLIQQPYVIMFDEPLDYCSEEFIDKFIEVLESMTEEHIIIISTSLIEIASRISKDLIVLHDGELTDISEDEMKLPAVRQAVYEILGEAGNGNI